MKTRIIKPQILVAAFSMALFFLSSCKKDSDPIVYGNSSVRVVNAVSTSQEQDFYQGDRKVSTAGLAFGASSSTYYTVTGGPSVLSFKNTGTTTTTAAASVGLEEGSSYTIFYYANATGGAEITGIRDDNTAPAAGKAKVRFLNLGFALNNSLNVSYSASGNLIVNNLGTGFSNYNTIDANTDLAVTVIGSPVSLVIPAATFASGKIYTVWFNSVTPTTVNYHVVAQN